MIRKKTGPTPTCEENTINPLRSITLTTHDTSQVQQTSSKICLFDGCNNESDIIGYHC